MGYRTTNGDRRQCEEGWQSVSHPAPFDPGEHSRPPFVTLPVSDGGSPVPVGALMTRRVRTCRPDETFAAAAHAMFESGCHYLPVLDRIGHPIGAVTDSDLRALGFRDSRGLREILVREAMGGSPVTCRENDDARAALRTMRARRVRDLPVVDGEGRLCGILSVSDLILWAEGHDSLGLRREAAATLAALVRHRGEVRSGSDPA